MHLVIIFLYLKKYTLFYFEVYFIFCSNILLEYWKLKGGFTNIWSQVTAKLHLFIQALVKISYCNQINGMNNWWPQAYTYRAGVSVKVIKETNLQVAIFMHYIWAGENLQFCFVYKFK